MKPPSMKPSSIHCFYHVIPQSDLIWLSHQITNSWSPTRKGEMLMCHI